MQARTLLMLCLLLLVVHLGAARRGRGGGRRRRGVTRECFRALRQKRLGVKTLEPSSSSAELHVRIDKGTRMGKIVLKVWKKGDSVKEVCDNIKEEVSNLKDVVEDMGAEVDHDVFSVSACVVQSILRASEDASHEVPDAFKESFPDMDYKLAYVSALSDPDLYAEVEVTLFLQLKTLGKWFC